jgi:hypothetical protein
VLSEVMDIIIKSTAAGDAPELNLTRRTDLSIQSACLLRGRRVIMSAFAEETSVATATLKSLWNGLQLRKSHKSHKATSGALEW